MSSNRRQRREIPVDAPIDGVVRVNKMTLREYQEQGDRANKLAAKSDAPSSAATVKLHNPPWSYLDPENSEWEDFGRQRVAGGRSGGHSFRKIETTLPPVEALLAFFKKNGRKPEFAQISQVTWAERAREDGVVFEKKDFDAAWRHATQAGDVVKLKGAPKKARQSKRLRATKNQRRKSSA